MKGGKQAPWFLMKGGKQAPVCGSCVSRHVPPQASLAFSSLLASGFPQCTLNRFAAAAAAAAAAAVALVFAQVGPMDIGLAAFTGRLGSLADRIVPCGPKQAQRSKQDWVNELRRRLQPVVRNVKA
jgi:hypothetical protein